MKKEFTKADLKVLMVVRYKNGNLRLVEEITEGMILHGDGCFNELYQYNDDLTEKCGNKEFDIVQVFGFAKNIVEKELLTSQ
jgi:hypothetical protein